MLLDIYISHERILSIIPFFVIVLFIFLFYLMYRSQRKKLEPLAAELGGKTSLTLLGAQVRLQKSGFEVFIRTLPGGGSAPPCLIIKQMSPLAFSLHIFKMAGDGRALIRLGMQDIKIGDPVFDAKYCVQSSDPGKAVNYIQIPARREAIEYFFNSGFTSLRATAKSISVTKPLSSLRPYRDRDFDPLKIRPHLDQIRKLAAE